METATKTAKITNVTANGSFNSKHGMMYKWEVAFENGDFGDANTKEQAQTKWKVGETVTYKIEPNGNYNPKLTLVTEKPQNNGQLTGKDPATQKMIVAQSSISSAVELYKHQTPIEDADVLATAETFFNWVMKKGAENGN